MPRIPARLVIVGEGPVGEALRAQASRLGLGDKVHFAGRVSDAELHDHLAAAGIGVLPSNTPTEAFGLALAEYMAAGLPVVSTDLGTGTSYVNQDGVSGLVVAANDPGALATGIGRLLSDPTLRVNMGTAGRARVREKFTTEAMMRGMELVYAEAMDRAGSRAPHPLPGPSGAPGKRGQGLP
jgi:rhamnosyl/mannosyltransferase